MPFGTSVQRESLLAPHAGDSQAPPCCPSLPLETSSFTSFSPAVQCQHQSPGILLRCRAHVSAKLGTGLFIMLLPNGEQVSSAKKKRAAELVAVPAELGQWRSRNPLLADQSAAWSLIVVLSPGLWGASSLSLDFFLWGIWSGFFFFFPLCLLILLAGSGEMPTNPAFGCVKVYHGSARFGNKSL